MNVIGPRPLDAAQRLAHRFDLAAAEFLFVEPGGDAVFEVADLVDDLQRLVGQGDADRAAVVRRALLLEIAHLGELLDVVGDVRALIVASLDEVADGDVLVADVGQQQGLYAVDVADAEPVQFGAQQIEESPVQALNQPG